MPDQPNIILLIFDTLRSDYLSCYDGEVETPSFDAIADQGVLFESAFTTGPGTPISHATLYSGQYPSETGVTGQYIRVPDDIPLMPSWLQQAGYETFGITGPAKMGSDWGYDRGFDELFEPYYDIGARPSKEYFKNILSDWKLFRDFCRTMYEGDTSWTKYKFELLEQRISKNLDEPFFALCNFVTVHLPYDPPRPYRTQATPDFSPVKWFFLEYLLDKKGEIENSDVRLDRILEIQNGDLGRFLADPDYLNEKEIQLLRDWYAASVRYLDDQLQRFFEFYKQELQEDTILILTADHGEQLGEHGLWEHSHYLYDETLKVPLIITGPSLPKNKRRSDLASLVDVFDTVCDLASIDNPDTTSGISLFNDQKRDAVYMEYGERDITKFTSNNNHGQYLSRNQARRFCAGRKGIRTKEYRYELTSHGSEHLYRLPEQEKIENPPKDLTENLQQQLLDTLGEEFGIWPEGSPDEVNLSQEVETNLRDLGYID